MKHRVLIDYLNSKTQGGAICVASHFSQRTREMGHPSFCLTFLRQTLRSCVSNLSGSHFSQKTREMGHPSFCLALLKSKSEILRFESVWLPLLAKDARNGAPSFFV